MRTETYFPMTLGSAENTSAFAGYQANKQTNQINKSTNKQTNQINKQANKQIKHN